MDEATELCRSCGFCCNGLLFDYVPVEEREVERLDRLGFAIRSDGAPRYEHPCPKFCGECAIYAERPQSCRQYRCELLKRAEAGELSFGKARAIVDEANDMVAAIRQQFELSATDMLPMAWTRRFEEWRSTPPEQRTESDSAVILEQTRLQRFLDIHFREPRQRKLIGK